MSEPYKGQTVVIESGAVGMNGTVNVYVCPKCGGNSRPAPETYGKEDALRDLTGIESFTEKGDAILQRLRAWIEAQGDE